MEQQIIFLHLWKTKIKKGNFKELVEKITKQNAFRPYPEINDIPN